MLLVTATTACIPLPIPHMAQVTPATTGTILRSDGSPAAGVHLATAEVQYAPDATPCRASRASAVSDSDGHFSLPVGRVHKTIFWLSWFENFGRTAYWLCADTSATQQAGPRLVAQISGYEQGDSIACIEWDWQAATRLTCNSPLANRIVTGGAWTDGRVNGIYRVILAEASPADTYNSRGFVQWLELSPAGLPASARTTIELPASDYLITWNGAAFAHSTSHWEVVVTSVRHPPHRPGTLRFELGPPGSVTLKYGQ